MFVLHEWGFSSRIRQQLNMIQMDQSQKFIRTKQHIHLISTFKNDNYITTYRKDLFE